MTPAEVLRKARAELERRGLYQGEYMDPDGDPSDCRVCALGAFAVALGAPPQDEDRWWRKSREARDLLMRTLDIHSIPRWNDAPERTHDEVLNAFDRAVALAEAQEQRK